MARPQAEGVLGLKNGPEKRNADDMVEVGVAEKDVRVNGTLVGQALAHFPQAGAAIEDKQMVVAANLHARRIAAIAQGIVAGTGDTAPHAPESDEKISQPGIPFRHNYPFSCISPC
jgi:hypothetical protein